MSNPFLSILFPCCTPRRRTSTNRDEESTPLLNNQAKGKGKGQDEDKQSDQQNTTDQLGSDENRLEKVFYDEKVLKRIVYDVQSSFIPLDKAQHSSNGTATSTTGSISLLNNSTTSASHLSHNLTPGPSRIPLPELESKDDVEAVSRIYLASLGGLGLGTGAEDQELIVSPISQDEEDSNIGIISGQTVVLPLKSNRKNSGGSGREGKNHGKRRKSNHSTGSSGSGSNLSQNSSGTNAGFRNLPRPLTLVRNVQLNLNSRSNSLESQNADQSKDKEVGAIIGDDKEISTPATSGSLGLINVEPGGNVVKDLGTKLREREEAQNGSSSSSSRSNSHSNSNQSQQGSRPLRVVNIWAGDDDDEEEEVEDLKEGADDKGRIEDEDNEILSLTPTATRSSTSSSATTPTKPTANLPSSNPTSNPNSISNSVSSLNKSQSLSLSITPTMNSISGRISNVRSPRNRSVGSGNSTMTGDSNTREREEERLKEEMNLKIKRRISNSQIQDDFERKLVEIERKNGKAHTRDQWGES